MTPDEEEELERLAMLRFRWQDRALKARAEVAELVERLGRIEGENQAAARMILERDERITELEHVVEVLNEDHRRLFAELEELRAHHHDPTTGMGTHDHEDPKPIRPNRTVDSI